MFRRSLLVAGRRVRRYLGVRHIAEWKGIKETKHCTGLKFAIGGVSTAPPQ